MTKITYWDVDDSEVRPNDEYEQFRWVDRAELESLESPVNVREFGFLALAAQARGYL